MFQLKGDGWEPVNIGESETVVYRRRDVFAKCCAVDVVRRGAVNSAFLTDEWRAVEPTSLLDRVVALRPYIESAAVDDLVCCHGDACLPNVFFDPTTLEVTGLIDVGRLGIADRYS